MKNISLKYRIYPSKNQVKKLEFTLATCCQVYNYILSDREMEYKLNNRSLSFYETSNRLSLFRQTWIELQNVHSQVLQDVAVRVDLAFKAFFRRVKAGENPGYPRSKGRNYYDSITFRQDGFGIKDNHLRLSKIGNVKIKLHREIIGKLKTCNIRRQNGKWYACFSTEFEPVILPKVNKQVGIDVGLEKFAAYSNGSFINNPRFFRKEEKNLAKAQRKLSKQTKHTTSYKKAKKVVSKIHERIKNKRQNFAHQLSYKIVKEHDFIAVEKLDIKSMTKNRCLSKSISDASWYQFIRYLTYKAENAGRTLVAINPAYTSQDCSSCGYRKKKPLKERWHFCPICGLSIDRDTNAAINILRLGLQSQIA